MGKRGKRKGGLSPKVIIVHRRSKVKTREAVENKKATARVAFLGGKRENCNLQFFAFHCLDYAIFSINFRNNIIVIFLTDTKYYFGFIGILYKPIYRP